MLNVSRRRFLQASGGLLLAVGMRRPGAQEDSLYLHRGFSPNAFVRVASDNTVTVVVKHLEMGQGTYTGLPTLVAEEMDADWSQVRVEGAPADAAKYNNLLWGAAQGTGGSTALANSWEQMRKAGAAARAMLVAAAAERWKVPVSEIRVAKGVISTKGHKATFGQLAGHAARQKVPADVKLKDPRRYVYIGKDAPRLPNTSCISFLGLNRQALVMALDLAGVACSTGSACASGSSEPSPTLVAMGLPKVVIDGAIRLSLGAFTTAAEVAEAARRILKTVKHLRSQNSG